MAEALMLPWTEKWQAVKEGKRLLSGRKIVLEVALDELKTIAW